MTSWSEAMPQSPSPERPPAAVRPYFWSVRRELWEHRSVFIAPVVAAALVLTGFLIGAVRLARAVRLLSTRDVIAQGDIVAKPFEIVCAAIIFTGLIVGFFYCLGALYNERRDRSLLFWKSLPVSDLTAVLAKATIPLIVLPVVTIVVIAAAQLIMLALSAMVLAGNGLNPGPLTLVPFGKMFEMVAYALGVFALWYAPLYGWLFLVSGWAKRAPFLWAVLPPMALGVVEKLAFDTDYMGRLIRSRLSGGIQEAFVSANFHGHSTDGSFQPDPARLFSSPGLWLGLIFAAAFFAAAVWQRRQREPI